LYQDPAEGFACFLNRHGQDRGTTWVTRDALRSLRDLAAAHKLTVSRAAAEILERGLMERIETAGLGFLGPAVEGAVKRGVGRLVLLLFVRQLMADAARRLNQAA
jgi:hypothetical protein